MKNNKFISTAKTVGVSITAALTMNSCVDKQLTKSQLLEVQNKTDSAVVMHDEYKRASSVLDLCEIKTNKYREANTNMVKKYAKKYIRTNIKNSDLQKFMLKATEDEYLIETFDYYVDAYDSVTGDTFATQMDTLRYIRYNQRWFNDLMLYLANQYTDSQFVKTEFFDVVKNPNLKKQFEYNTKQIEEIQSAADFATQRKDFIYGQIWNKYEKEAQKHR